ncbi:hypothetical protein V8E55_007523 [Tylopilus felleus]
MIYPKELTHSPRYKATSDISPQDQRLRSLRAEELSAELNVDPVTLKDFEETIWKDLVGAGPYPQARNTIFYEEVDTTRGQPFRCHRWPSVLDQTFAKLTKHKGPDFDHDPSQGIQDLHIGNSAVFDGDHVVHVRQGPDKYGAYNRKSSVTYDKPVPMPAPTKCISRSDHVLTRFKSPRSHTVAVAITLTGMTSQQICKSIGLIYVPLPIRENSHTRRPF